MKNYQVIGVHPDCTREVFISVLKNSPAASAASRVYDECVSRRVSPLFILGMFWVESKFGTLGWAAKTRSWGNTRPPSYGYAHSGVYNQDTGQYYPNNVIPPKNGRYLSEYPSWAAGGIATVARLVLNTAYKNADNVREIIYIWGPPSDNNDTEAYIMSVLSFIDSYLVSLPALLQTTKNVVINGKDFGGSLDWITEVRVQGINQDGSKYERTWRIDDLHPWSMLFNAGI